VTTSPGRDLVVAVDGGNSKTDVALLSSQGVLSSWVRGPGSALDPPDVATLARTAWRRLGGGPGWALVLGGGLFAGPAGRLLSAVRPYLGDFTLRVVTEPPVAGAALLGLDHIGTTVDVETVRRAFRGHAMIG
jgi:hypothetical protein